MTPLSSDEPVADLLDRAARRARVEADLDSYKGLRVLIQEMNLYGDLDAEIDRCVPPLHTTRPPNRATRRKLGLHFNPAEVKRFIQFCQRLRHTKGRFAGGAFTPDLWQVLYIIAPVFGIRQSDGNRYYHELFLEIPRKNGKSTLAAAIALYLLMADSNLEAGRMFEAGAEVYAAATTTEQAKNVFRASLQMAKRSPSVASRCSFIGETAIIYEAKLSRYAVVSGAPSKAEDKMGDNLSGGIIDETHVHKSRTLIDTMESSTPGRVQPLIAHLTTAGSDVEGTIYAEKHDFAIAQSEGKVEDVRTWSVVYTIPKELEDQWDQPAVWEAANPGLPIGAVEAAYFEDKVKKARHSAQLRTSFCRLHLNVRASTTVRWTDLDHYDASGAYIPVSWPDLRDAVGYAGLDLSSTTDLSALTVLIPRWEPDPTDHDFEIETLEVLLRAWTPLDQLRTRTRVQRDLYTRWIREGHLIGCTGMTIDYDAIEAEIGHLGDYLDLRRLSFDRWGSKQMVGHLRQGGMKVVDMGQGFQGMSPAMKETERIILDHRLRHGGNPLLRYAFENLVVELDPAGNIKPNRTKSTGPIDPAVSTIMAVESYSREVYGESVYEETGLTVA